MVHYLLKMQAELQNITDLHPQDGCNDPNFTYYFKMKCGNCGELTKKEMCLTLNDKLPPVIGKGDVHFAAKGRVDISVPHKEYHLAMKCKLCSRRGTVTMLKGYGSPLTLGLAQSEKYAPLMLFGCNGFEPVDFTFGGCWKALSTGGTSFTDIDLSGGEFVEYDEFGQCPVMISNLRFAFVVKRAVGSAKAISSDYTEPDESKVMAVKKIKCDGATSKSSTSAMFSTKFYMPLAKKEGPFYKKGFKGNKKTPIIPKTMIGSMPFLEEVVDIPGDQVLARPRLTLADYDRT